MPMEQSVRLGRKANLDKMEPLVLRVISARLVLLVLKVSTARQARWDPRVPLVKTVKMELLVQWARQVQQASEDPRVNLGSKAQ